MGFLQVRGAIVHDTPGPGLFRICPKCGKWFGLRLKEKTLDEVVEKVEVYCCRRCGEDSRYAESLPPHSV